MLPPPRPAPPDDALPAGRIRYSLTAPRLLLHSVMPGPAYEVLRSAGSLTCDPAYIEPHMRRAYRWLSDQYARRVSGGYAGPLLWAWARIRRADLLDLLHEWEADAVLVTLRIPRERVLLTDFADWHAVLNVWELHPRALDDDEADRRIDAFWEEVDATGVLHSPIEAWPGPLRGRVVRSWDQVFEIGPPPRAVQAVVSRFDATDVVDAVALRR